MSPTSYQTAPPRVTVCWKNCCEAAGIISTKPPRVKGPYNWSRAGAIPRDGRDDGGDEVGREVFDRGACGAGEADGFAVGGEVGDAGVAEGQVAVEDRAALDGELACDVVVEERDHFAADDHVAGLMCSSRSARSACRARWRRILTAFALMPRMSAVSSVLISSMSRSWRTTRWVSGRRSMAARTCARSSSRSSIDSADSVQGRDGSTWWPSSWNRGR